MQMASQCKIFEYTEATTGDGTSQVTCNNKDEIQTATYVTQVGGCVMRKSGARI